MKDDESAADKMERVKLEDSRGGVDSPMLDTATDIKTEASPFATPSQDGAQTPSSARPARSRKSSQKPVPRQAPLFSDLPNKTNEACKAFQVIPDCLYGSKNMGSAGNEAFDCDCREEWRKSSQPFSSLLPS